MARSVALAIGAAAALGLSHAALAEIVVVRSTGPSAAQYPQGKRLATNAAITLKTHDRVTVVDKAGTRVLSGPGTFSLDGRVVTDQSPSTRIAAVLSGWSGARARTGGVRGTSPIPVKPGEAPRSPNLWDIDVSRPGTYCVADPAAVVLWLPDAKRRETARLRGPDGSSAAVTWKRGSPMAFWPVDRLAVTAGDHELIRAGGAVTIKTVLVGPASGDVDDVAATLIANDCTIQLDYLVEALAAAEVVTGAPAAG